MRTQLSIMLGVVLVLTLALAPVAASDADLLDLAVDALLEEGFSIEDVEGVIITDSYTSDHNEVTHVYLRQTVDGEPVNGANATVAIQNGEVIHLAAKNFVIELGQNATGELLLDPEQALIAAAAELATSPSDVVGQPVAGYRALGDGTARRVYTVELNTGRDWWIADVDAETGEVVHHVNLVDHEDMAAIAATTARPESVHTVLQGFANSDQVELEEFQEAVNAPVYPPEQAIDGSSYNVYPMPVENPRDGDRLIVDNPADALASPLGWHDTDGVAGPEHTTTRGNNVHAYADTITSPYVTVGGAPQVNEPDPASEPDGGESLDFDFPIVSFDATPASYRDAAVTNLFYMNNIMHDVTFRYGFNEAAGNFQQTNYSGLGDGGDAVNAEAQDGNFVLNANFATPADGAPGRMQMFLWVDAFRDLDAIDGNVEDSDRVRSTQVRDGDVDSGVIAHEYGHGVSNRLVGGPNTVGCLSSHDEREGEGWSDFWSWALTAREGEDGATPRGIGNYVVYYDEFEPRQGPGIRITPYSTDMAVNPSTYNTITGAAEPHGVGYVWASMLWDLYWNMVDRHGFNANHYEDWTTGGNNRTVQLVVDGMKFAPCEPSFVEARDAILAAEAALTGDPANGIPGEDECLIWATFARRGLGVGADAGDYRSKVDQTESFEVPSYCS